MTETHAGLKWNMLFDQVITAQWLARQLATMEVPGSNPAGMRELIILVGLK